MQMFKWYRVEQRTGMMMMVPGGWLVRYQTTDPPMIFIEDPTHEHKDQWLQGARQSGLNGSGL